MPSENEKLRENTIYAMHVAFNLSRREIFCVFMDKHQCSHKRDTDVWEPPQHSLVADSIAYLADFDRKYLHQIATEPGAWDGVPVVLADYIKRESWPNRISWNARWIWAVNFFVRSIQDTKISALAEEATYEYTEIYEKLVSISGEHLRSLSYNRTKWAEFFS